VQPHCVPLMQTLPLPLVAQFEQTLPFEPQAVCVLPAMQVLAGVPVGPLQQPPLHCRPPAQLAWQR
jgi:hypothetical protein